MIFEITLRAERHRIEPIVRVRQMLKAALRNYALRAIRCVETGNGSPPSGHCPCGFSDPHSSGSASQVEYDTMRSVRERFPDKFKRCADFVGRQEGVIDHAEDITFKSGDTILAVYLRGDSQGFRVTRRDNAIRMADAWGDDPAGWAGQRVAMVAETLSSGTKSIGMYPIAASGKPNRKQPRQPPWPAEEAQAPLDSDPELADDPIS
jgi:hypothetical protein